MSDQPNIIATFQHAMPDGRPCPDVLTEAEAIKYLRLDKTGIRNPKRTLQHYRTLGKLKGAKIGRAVVYPLAELQRFVKTKMMEDAA